MASCSLLPSTRQAAGQSLCWERAHRQPVLRSLPHPPDTVAVATLTPRARACDSNVKGSPATPSCTPWPPLPLTSLSAPRVLRSCSSGSGVGGAVGE